MVHVIPGSTIGSVGTSSVGEAPAAPSTGEGAPTTPESTIAAGLAAVAPGVPTGDSTGGERIKALAQKAKASGEKVVDVLIKPTSQTANSVTYKLGGRELKPGEAIYMAVPDSLGKRPVAMVIIGHRGNPATDTDPDKTDKWDATPALTSAQIHGIGIDEGRAWRYWRGNSSGSKGAKFAEVGYNIELENLYEWRKYGHAAESDDSSTTAPLYPDAIRVRSMGLDPVELHEVTLKVAAPKPDELMEAVFSPGTVIGDPETGLGRKYGGGQGFEGLFPGAVQLRSYGSSSLPGAMPEGWKLTNGMLEVSLKPGMKLTAIDVACGDSHPDKIHNSDGGWGTKGWAKLHIGLQKAGGPTEWFMQSENVPPEGVLTASPIDGNYVTKAGDKILIRCSSDVTYVMAARVGLMKP